MTNLCVVVLPHPPGDLVAAQVEGLEVDAAHLQLLRRWVLRRLVLRQALILEHVHQRRLARIIEPLQQVVSQISARVQRMEAHEQPNEYTGGRHCSDH